MAVDSRVIAALDPSRLDLPATPRVVRLTVEDYVDSTGADALLIWAVLSDDTTDEQLMNGPAIMKLKHAVSSAVRAAGVQLFPYVRIATESELAEPAEVED